MASFIKKILPFFDIALISVILEVKTCTVFVKIVKNSKVINTEEKKFDINNAELSSEVIKYINSYQDNYKFTYIGTLLGSINQGAISGCKSDDFKKFGIRLDNIDFVCINNMLGVYGVDDDIVTTQNKFNKTVGIDFIYSPFVVLYQFFKKELIDEAKLYVLCQKSYVALAVFKEKRFIFGAYFSIDTTEDTFKEEGAKPSSSEVDVSDVNKDSEDEDLDELVFFEDDEDVISLDDSDEEEIEDYEDEDEDESDLSSIESFQEGVDLHNYIKSSIEEFYKNDKYETEFLSDIIIADSCSLTEDVKKYIEDELMLNVKTKEINIAKVTTDIMQKEVMG